jgi:hypothetical protein
VPANETSAEQAFIAEVAPGAIATQREYGVPASVTIAQAILESGWGQSYLAAHDYNLFGMKGRGPAGSDALPTQEYENGQWVNSVSLFRVYNNFSQSIADHGQELATSGYYTRAMANKQNPDAFANALTGVYATDPDYGAKLINLMQEFDLYQYDAAPAAAAPAPAARTSPAPGKAAPSPAPGKAAPAKGAPTKTGPAKTGPAKTGPAKTGPAKTGPAKTASVPQATSRPAPVKAPPAPAARTQPAPAGAKAAQATAVRRRTTPASAARPKKPAPAVQAPFRATLAAAFRPAVASAAFRPATAAPARRAGPYGLQIPLQVKNAFIELAKAPLATAEPLYRDVASHVGIRWELLAACDWMECEARPGYSPVHGEKLGARGTDGTVYRTKSEALEQCAYDLVDLALAVYGIDLTGAAILSVRDLASVFAAFRWGGLLRLHHTSAMEFPYSVAGLTDHHINMHWPDIDEPNAPDKPGTRFRLPFGAVPIVLGLHYPATAA